MLGRQRRLVTIYRAFDPTVRGDEPRGASRTDELLPFGVDSILVEPGVYRTGIHDHLIGPADTIRVKDYGSSAAFAERVNGVFQAITGAPDAPGSEEVVEALVALIDMAPELRPFRTVVSAPIQQLLGPYNDSADALRPVVAQIFNVPDLVRA